MTERDLREAWTAAAANAELDDDDDLEGFTPREKRASDPSQVYSLRIPVRHLHALRRLAASRNVTPTGLMRAWVVERLEQEEVADRARQFSQTLGFDGAWVDHASRTLEHGRWRYSALSMTSFPGHGSIVQELQEDITSDRPLIEL